MFGSLKAAIAELKRLGWKVEPPPAPRYWPQPRLDVPTSVWVARLKAEREHAHRLQGAQPPAPVDTIDI